MNHPQPYLAVSTSTPSHWPASPWQWSNEKCQQHLCAHIAWNLIIKHSPTLFFRISTGKKKTCHEYTGTSAPSTSLHLILFHPCRKPLPWNRCITLPFTFLCLLYMFIILIYIINITFCTFLTFSYGSHFHHLLLKCSGF